jgi:hypothetical protein
MCTTLQLSFYLFVFRVMVGEVDPQMLEDNQELIESFRAAPIDPIYTGHA